MKKTVKKRKKRDLNKNVKNVYYTYASHDTDLKTTTWRVSFSSFALPTFFIPRFALLSSGERYRRPCRAGMGGARRRTAL